MNNKDSIIFTIPAKCRDCYKCLKVCPVKAIKMRDGQAHIDPQKCILCGTCIRECPQKAKVYREDISLVKEFINNGEIIAASIAPSFSSVYSGWKKSGFIAALRKSGFNYVEETANGAYYIAKESIKAYYNSQKEQCICSACPVINNYIEKYFSNLIQHLIPVTSPMIAHAKILKKKYGRNIKVVFIGPCIAKKFEAERFENNETVDAVLTFNEVEKWFKESKIHIENCADGEFDCIAEKNSKLFALPGGLLKTAEIEQNKFDMNFIETSGHHEFLMAIDDFNSVENSNPLIEPLFCSGGCIGGPGLSAAQNKMLLKKNIVSYSTGGNSKSNFEFNLPAASLKTVFNKNIQITCQSYSEEEIERVLLMTGKTEASHLLNCGACGYQSCREKAIAVLSGMAESEMCLPYMRKIAEQKTDMLIDKSPNSIVIVDENLKILKMNPAFQELFKCENSVYGKKISVVMDPFYFEKLINENTAQVENNIELNIEGNNFYCHQILYSLKPDNQYAGIFIDVIPNRYQNY